MFNLESSKTDSLNAAKPLVLNLKKLQNYLFNKNVDAYHYLYYIVMGNQQTISREEMRKGKRLITRGVRKLDRELIHLKNEEKKIVAEIKTLAKNGQINACKIRAKDSIRSRRYITKYYEMKSKLQGIGLQLQVAESINSISIALKGVTASIKAFNKDLSDGELNDIMKEFMKENEKMGITEEMVGDAIDMSLDSESDLETSDQVVNQVLSEIGIEVTDQMEVHISGRKIKEEKQQINISEYEERFRNLR